MTLVVAFGHVKHRKGFGLRVSSAAPEGAWAEGRLRPRSRLDLYQVAKNWTSTAFRGLGISSTMYRLLVILHCLPGHCLSGHCLPGHCLLALFGSSLWVAPRHWARVLAQGFRAPVRLGDWRREVLNPGWSGVCPVLEKFVGPPGCCAALVPNAGYRGGGGERPNRATHKTTGCLPTAGTHRSDRIGLPHHWG